MDTRPVNSSDVSAMFEALLHLENNIAEIENALGTEVGRLDTAPLFYAMLSMLGVPGHVADLRYECRLMWLRIQRGRSPLDPGDFPEWVRQTLKEKT